MAALRGSWAGEDLLVWLVSGCCRGLVQGMERNWSHSCAVRTKASWAALTVESSRGTRCKELEFAGEVEKLSQSHPSQSQTSRQVPQKVEAISGCYWITKGGIPIFRPV